MKLKLRGVKDSSILDGLELFDPETGDVTLVKDLPLVNKTPEAIELLTGVMFPGEIRVGGTIEVETPVGTITYKIAEQDGALIAIPSPPKEVLEPKSLNGPSEIIIEDDYETIIASIDGKAVEIPTNSPLARSLRGFKDLESFSERVDRNMDLGELRSAGRLQTRTLPTGDKVEVVEKSVSGVIKGINDDGTITVIASDETVDRYGDIIRVSGWNLKDYKKNPVILTDHTYSVSNIVGHAKRVRKDRETKQLLIDIKLDDPGTNAEADKVRNLVANGSLRSTSVGFIPKVWEKIMATDNDGNQQWTGGFEFKKQDLLEDSFVAVPANPNANVVSADDTTPAQRDTSPVEPADDVTSALIASIVARFKDHDDDQDDGSKEALELIANRFQN